MSENLLAPKTHRSKKEIGREVMRLVREHGEIRVTEGDSPYDVAVYPADE